MQTNQTIESAARWAARAVGALLVPLIFAFAVGDGVLNPLRGTLPSYTVPKDVAKPTWGVQSTVTWADSGLPPLSVAAR